MTLREELYDLWRRESDLEVSRAFQQREALEATTQRDELLALLWKHGIQGPDASCRICDAPMSMRPWNRQYCSRCLDD